MPPCTIPIPFQQLPSWCSSAFPAAAPHSAPIGASGQPEPCPHVSLPQEHPARSPRHPIPTSPLARAPPPPPPSAPAVLMGPDSAARFRTGGRPPAGAAPHGAAVPHHIAARLAELAAGAARRSCPAPEGWSRRKASLPGASLPGRVLSRRRWGRWYRARGLQPAQGHGHAAHTAWPPRSRCLPSAAALPVPHCEGRPVLSTPYPFLKSEPHKYFVKHLLASVGFLIILFFPGCLEGMFTLQHLSGLQLSQLSCTLKAGSLPPVLKLSSLHGRGEKNTKSRVGAGEPAPRHGQSSPPVIQ